ncbi:Protein SON [Frankliniella fusca]|uniref:Protein SON n=1 Tax=Frankliniella fusca TaxID=407009 RepID=A0AAE1HQY0_9NEOP|nr:Protein SON [Frankliniella fusca]
MQLHIRAQSNHVLECAGSETISQIKEQISHLEDVPKELLCLYSEGSPLNDELSVESLTSGSIDVTIPLLGGKVHGSLARAGKVKGQTPKVEKQEKKKKKTGRCKRRIQYNRRFVNVVQDWNQVEMAAVEDEVSSSAQAEDLWNIAITSKDESTSDVPQKSSNEILTELFGAFNAEPPKSIIASDCDSENEVKVKKHKKKHKKEKKHKKKSKSKRRLSGEQDNSSIGYSSDSDNEHEKRKERKHKPKKKRRTKSSDMESEEEQKPKKRSRHSKSPSLNRKEISSDNADEQSKEVSKDCSVAVKADEVNKNAESEVSSSTPAPPQSPPPLPTPKKEIADESSVFENVKTSEGPDEKSDKSKPPMGKIVIKNLKFSSVFEATVKEVEEQAKAKAEKYEEGELSDTSSQKTSELSDDHANAPSLGSEGGEVAEPNGRLDENSEKSKSTEKISSHHKKSKHRSRSRSKSRSRSRDHDHKSRDKERHCRHKDKERDKERDKIKEKDRHKDRDREKERDKDKSRGRDRDRDRDRNRDRDRDRDRDKDRKDKDHRDRRRGHSRSRSRSRSPRSRNRSSSRSRRRHSRDRRRSRSRSRDRKRTSGGDHIDKKKLLEIARRNAMNMLQAGILPGNIMGKAPDPAPSVAAPADKPQKSAAKTVDELTEYCKELSKRENMGELSSLSGSEESDSEKPFHHPFQVKDRPSFISLNIKNAVQLPLKSMQERTMESSQLRIQFPVSSGQQHRKTENEWIPVTPPTKAEEKKSSGLKAIEAPKPAEKSSQSASSEVIDIGTLVSQRLSALRKKHDSEQNQYIDHMYGWNNALPGQFTGDTGVRLLTPQQLASGAQAWARKDQLQTATPVRSGMGMTLLQKMGWKPGEGLGKNKEGCQEPLQLEVKMDRKGKFLILLSFIATGLVAAEEIRARRPPPTVSQPRQAKANPVTLEGKHPVSLLTEYCSKRHYGAPHFELCLESGPDHKKDFLFKVRVNGLEYTPSTASPNKKQAKAEAATVCLKSLGVLLS